MGLIGNIFKELKKHLTNTPSYAFNIQATQPIFRTQLDYINTQIEKAIKEKPNQILFILAPFGAGKTTQIFDFFQKHPEHQMIYRSFTRINTLDFAFLHLTNYASRFFFLLINSLLSVALFYTFPKLSVLPIFFLLSSFFTKSVGNQIYLLHETLSTWLNRRQKFVVIEDLERSPLGDADQWAFLSNLWHLKRTYVVSLGYSPEEKDKVIKLFELAIKLGGTLVELPLNESANYELIKKLDLDFPFHPSSKDLSQNKGWLSLFTFRELFMLREQALLRVHAEKEFGRKHLKPHLKQIKYVEVGLMHLLEKLNLTKREIVFVEKDKEIVGFSKERLQNYQTEYLQSFFHSIYPELGIKVKS